MRKLLALLMILIASPAWADGTIDSLAPGAALGGTEAIPMVQGAPPAVKTTPNALKTFMAVPAAANPTATIGTAAVNGAATTFMRSDAAPAFGNLTGPITSTGMATAIASQTGTGSKIVVDTSPTLVTPVLGVATGTSLALGAPGGSTSSGDVNITGVFKVNGTPISTGGGSVTLNTSSLIYQLPNEAGTGTAAGKLVIDTAGTAKTAAVTDTSNVIGICVSGITGTSCGNSGSASIAIAGLASCVFDGATTAGDFVTVSTTAAGDCHDAGNTVPAGSFVIGNVLTTNGAGGTYQVDLSPIGATAALNSKAKPGGTSGQLQINSSGSFGGITLGGDCTFSTPNITCTKTGGSAFVASATTDTTNASNISSGTLSNSRLSGVALLGTSQSFTAGQAVTPTADGTQAAGGTLTMDFSASNYHTATFGAGNLTIANPSNIKAGECGWLALTQDGVGSRTVTSWGGDWKFSGGTKPTLTTTASASDLITWCAVSTSVIAAQLSISNYQ